MYVHGEQAMRFEWDAEKNRRNIAKHKVSFDTATFIFDDSNQVSVLERIVDGEERWQTVGTICLCQKQKILVLMKFAC